MIFTENPYWTSGIRDDPYWTSGILRDDSYWTSGIRDDPYWTFWKNSLELIELSSINKVSLVYVSTCCNTGSISDDPY